MMPLELQHEFMKLLEDDIKIDSSYVQPGQTKIIEPNNLDSVTYQRLKTRLDDIKTSLKYGQYHDDPIGKQNAENQMKDHLDKLGLQHVITFIENNCGDYLDIMQGHRKFLYRGVSLKEHNSGSFFIGNSRTDRQPKDSDPKLQNVWNQALAELNIKANRSNSIFTTNDRNQASIYGTLYLIFPFNGASFSWSRLHSDLVLSEYTMSNTLKIEVTAAQRTKFQSYVDYAEKLYNSSEMMDIRYAAEDKPGFSAERIKIHQFENLISNSRAFLINPSKELLHDIDMTLRSILTIWRRVDSDNNYIGFMELIEEISKQSKFDVDQFQKIFNVSNKNFGLALLSKHEICISGHYVAVKYDYEPYLRDKFFGDR